MAPPRIKRKPVVLLTGVTSGIGLALARMLWKDSSYRVVATAREKSLSKISSEDFAKGGDDFLLLPLDVTSAKERERVVEEVNHRLGGTDILINNAGIAFRSVFEHMSDKDLYRQFMTNFLGPMALARLVLPGMRERGDGRIINVSSVGGMMAMPTMSAYSASKFALEGATESLWYEVRPWNIKVSLVQPGFVHSESFRNVPLSKKAIVSATDPADAYHQYYNSMAPFVERMMMRAYSTPEHVARVILRTMRKSDPALRVPATVDAWFFGFLRRVLPRGLYHALLYRSLPNIRNWGRD